MKRQMLIGLVLALSATCCSVPPASSPVPTETLEPVSPPTATIDWFPTTPTPTPTLAPTLEPTSDMRPGLGKVIYEDDFSDHSRWATAMTYNGSIAYGVNEITLAISKPQRTLQTQPQNLQLDNFYLEITANPSLCSENDVYGILFRVNSPYDYYRLLFSCAGKVRIERVQRGTTNPLQDWVYAGKIPPGAPLMVNLGLWVSGSSIRLFAEDFFLFEVEDNSFTSGGIGLYARSGGTTPLTVSFRSLSVYELETTTLRPSKSQTFTTASSGTPTRTPTGTAPTRTPTP